MRARIEARFLEPTRVLTEHETSGFVLLVVDSLVIEYLQRLRTGDLYKKKRSHRLVTDCLRERPSFSEFFREERHKDKECACVACDFYQNARSGIAHDGETRNGWRVRYGEPKLLAIQDGVRVVDRNRFHAALEKEFRLYFDDLLASEQNGLRAILKRALDGICGLPSPPESSSSVQEH